MRETESKKENDNILEGKKATIGYVQNTVEINFWAQYGATPALGARSAN